MGSIQILLPGVHAVEPSDMTANRKRSPTLIVLCLAAAGILVAGGWSFMVWGGELRELAGEARSVAVEFLGAIHPFPYFLAFALTPALGMPVSLFYLTAGPVLSGAGDGLLAPVLLAWLALGINIAFGYWLASSFMNPAISAFLRSRGHRIPRASPDNEGTLILVCRLSPLPFALQNWVLGVARFRFVRYMAYSLPIQAGIGTGMILVGDSLLRGGPGMAVIGVFLVCAFILLARLGRKRFHVGREQQESSNY